MKYNVTQLKDGSFAVDAGRGKYFTNTKTSDKNEAEREAMIRSMAWHQEQMRKIFKKGVKFGVFDDGLGMNEYLC